MPLKIKTAGEKSDIPDWSAYSVLIAEDIEPNFIYLLELLRPTGIQIIRAKNGREAIDLHEKNHIDIVLMDILMPEMDGYEAAKRLKERNQNLPIIAQTAYGLKNDWEKSTDKNFDDYLLKPIWRPDLLKAMKDFMPE